MLREGPCLVFCESDTELLTHSSRGVCFPDFHGLLDHKSIQWVMVIVPNLLTLLCTLLACDSCTQYGVCNMVNDHQPQWCWLFQLSSPRPRTGRELVCNQPANLCAIKGLFSVLMFNNRRHILDRHFRGTLVVAYCINLAVKCESHSKMCVRGSRSNMFKAVKGSRSQEYHYLHYKTRLQ
jgi:hypothetical protein